MIKTSLSDEELWSNILAGDDRSFAAFYDRYWLRMYKTALYYLRDKNASEEVVQEVFLLIWNKRETLDVRNFAAYLNMTTRYEVFRKMRSAKQSVIKFHEYYPQQHSIDYNHGYERLNEIDSNHALDDCLKSLPKRCREIFYLSKIKQLNNAEIAEQLDISKHTVENQLAIALKHLKVNFTQITLTAFLLTDILDKTIKR